MRNGTGRAARHAAPCLVLLLLATAACASNDRPRSIKPEYDLHDPDPMIRMQAIHAVSRSGDRTQVPQLIEMLDDQDEAVRMVAIGTLRELTDYDSDYKAYAPRTERRAQVQQWRDWYAARDVPRIAPLVGPETQ